MMSIAASLDAAIRAAGVSITGVSIGRRTDKTTWKVYPPELQVAAQPTIDGFDPNSPDTIAADLARCAANDIDGQRILAAFLWEVINAVNPPVTRAKFLAARTNIIEAYKTAPWKP